MNLQEFFKEHSRVAVAFSGGVDSSYLLYAAKKSGADVMAIYVKSAFQPQFEYDDAMRLAKGLGVDVKVLHLNALSDERVAQNPANRCYYCKLNIFSAIIAAAKAEGFSEIIDVTNASDDAGDRPGMVALKELKVLSPLRLCGLTKDEIRRLSKESGLFTWDKPAYACLATRIRTGQRITLEDLEKTEKAEGYLFSLGFRDFRVRLIGDLARIQIPKDQFGLMMEKREEVLKELNIT